MTLFQDIVILATALVTTPPGVDSVSVSGLSPFPISCNGQQPGVNYRNAEVEPWVAVDPTNPQHLIGVWQQDRWSNGGASGDIAGVSLDGGQHWTTTFPRFSVCSGGMYQRATDPWVSFSPDGTAYSISYSFNSTNANQAILVSRSKDGGFSWSEPVPLIQDTSQDVADDKETITADPHDARYVYAVWDRLTGLTSKDPNATHGPVWFARTTDNGATWEPARIIYDPGPNAQTIGNEVVVLRDGTLVNVFTTILNTASPANTQKLFATVLRSSDHGVTWSAPITISTEQPAGVSDLKTGNPVRTGSALPCIVVDPRSDAMYVAWEDARFHGLEAIAVSKSTDNGLNWTAPVQVNQATSVQAFNPAIAVAPSGQVGIMYYDFRNDSAGAGTLLTSIWRATSRDGGATWNETALAGPFDLLTAPVATGDGNFLGDYAGLVWAGDSFLAFFTATNSGDTANRTDVFASRGALHPVVLRLLK